MKNIIFYIGFIFFISCGSDDERMPVIIDLNPTTGLLGQTLMIPISGITSESNLQIFFGNEEATFFIEDEEHLNIRIPRSLSESETILQVIDLNTNETIAEAPFALLAPSISGYSIIEAIFGEPFEILGENFDTQIEDISVKVNNESAQILESSYNSITILLPSFINQSTLDIEVTAQRQSVVNSEISLKQPELILPDGNNVSYGDFAIEGIGLNPEGLGNVFVDGVEANFFVGNNYLVVNIPPGIYDDFVIQELRYEYAGFVTILDTELNITEAAILIDQNPNALYTYVYEEDIYGIGNLNADDITLEPKYGFFKFESETEKWERISNWEFDGTIEFTVYDNQDRIYIQKNLNGGILNYEWSFVDLNTFQETIIETPVSNRFFNSNEFAFQDGLYVLGGYVLTPESTIEVQNVKLKLNRNTLVWEELPANMFEGIPMPQAQNIGSVSNPLHANGKLYLSQNDNFDPVIIVNPDLSVETFYQEIFLIINDDVILRNSSSLINLDTGNQVDFDAFVGFGADYVNGTLYYRSYNEFNYYFNEALTAKLRPGLLDGLF